MHWPMRCLAGADIGDGTGGERIHLPWLTGTAFLHSVMMQEKRGMMKSGTCGSFSHLPAFDFGTFP